MRNSTHWTMYEYYDTEAMNNNANKYADARNSDQVDHLAVLISHDYIEVKKK